MLRSSNVGAPVTLGSPGSAAAQAYLEAAQRLKGDLRGPAKASGDRPGLFSKPFPRRAA